MGVFISCTLSYLKSMPENRRKVLFSTPGVKLDMKLKAEAPSFDVLRAAPDAEVFYFASTFFSSSFF